MSKNSGSPENASVPHANPLGRVRDGQLPVRRPRAGPNPFKNRDVPPSDLARRGFDGQPAQAGSLDNYHTPV